MTADELKQRLTARKGSWRSIADAAQINPQTINRLMNDPAYTKVIKASTIQRIAVAMLYSERAWLRQQQQQKERPRPGGYRARIASNRDPVSQTRGKNAVG